MKHARSMDRPLFSFSFELSYRRAPRSPVLGGLARWVVGSHKRLLQSPASLCRMVVAVLIDLPPHHNQIGQRLAV
jgi:hypothetical protein